MKTIGKEIGARDYCMTMNSKVHAIHNLVFVTVPLIIFLVGVVPLVYSLVLYFKRKRSN